MNWFKHIIFLTIVAFTITSCCKRFVPTTSKDVTDSTYETTIIKYHSDTIQVKGDTVMIEKQIPCPDVIVDTVAISGKARLHISLKNGMLKAACKTDSLLKVIDSLETRVTEKTRVRVEKITVRQPVEVVKYRTPGWCWLLIAGVVAFAGAKFIFTRYFLKI